MAESRDVVVIGGGISGLACAYFLKQRGVNVVVLESDGRAGGVIRSARENGFLRELGPNSTLASKPSINELISDLDLDDRVVVASDEAKNRYILKNGALVPMPMAPPTIFSSQLFSGRAKARLFSEPFRRARDWSDDDADESVASFARRRFGEEVLDYALGPFVAGVYAGDPEKLSVRSAFPMLVEFEREAGSVIKGAIRARKAGKSTIKSRMISFDDGMSVLTDALVDELGTLLITNAPAQHISPDESGAWRVSCRRDGESCEITCAAVVLSAPADAVAGLVEHLDSQLASRLRDVPYAPVASVYTGYGRSQVSHPLDGFGFLIPKKENRRILGTIFSSSLFPGRAPENTVALTTFVGGTRQPELAQHSTGEIIALVTAELEEIIGARGEPVVATVQMWDRAIPQYVIGHHRLDSHLDAFTEVDRGVFIAANFRGGVSVADCIESAYTASKDVTKYLPASGYASSTLG